MRTYLALFPASLLPYKEQWQEIANGLPDGEILIILPDTRHHLYKTLETVASLLKSAGHPVTTLPAERFLSSSPYAQSLAHLSNFAP